MDAVNAYFVDILTHHFADFEGRARRKEYWMFYLFSILAIVGIVVVFGVLSLVADVFASVGTLAYFAFALALFIPSLAVAVRRLHDTGRSGWWYLIAFVPLGGFVIIYFLVIEGDAGPNEYGADPKDPYRDAQEISDLSGVLDR